jgi:hypothetical protein
MRSLARHRLTPDMPAVLDRFSGQLPGYAYFFIPMVVS